MNRTTTTVVFQRSRHVMALGLGLLLGQAALLMAQRAEGSVSGFGFATLFIVSASASFVFFVLSHPPVPPAARSRLAHSLVGLIGLGLLVSLHAADLLS